MNCVLRKLSITTGAIAVILIAGCGYGSTDRVPVKGMVKFNGRVVDNGLITFVPVGGGNRPTAAAEITDGKYAFEKGRGPMPGKYRVEILWNQKTGKQIATPGDASVGMDETVQVLPPQYNTNSTLEADVGSKTTFDFDLTQ
jgi:hypothetical protein